MHLTLNLKSILQTWVIAELLCLPNVATLNKSLFSACHSFHCPVENEWPSLALRGIRVQVLALRTLITLALIFNADSLLSPTQHCHPVSLSHLRSC